MANILDSNVPASTDTVLDSQTVAIGQELAPDLVRDSELNLRIDYVSNMPFTQHVPNMPYPSLCP